MAELLFIGSSIPEPTLFHAIIARGHVFTWSADLRVVTAHLECAPAPAVIVALAADSELALIAGILRHYALRWVTWNTRDDPAVTLAAYDAGASIVLPCCTTGAILEQALATINIKQSATEHRSSARSNLQRHARGAIIHLPSNAVLGVEQGIVAQTMIHDDGSEVLLGFYGPGQLLIGHPDDMCSIQLQAHTATIVRVQAWAAAASSPVFAEQLRTRILLMEAWAAMQARPYLDQRIMGMLSVLAEQFGVPHVQGLLVDVRVTHAQLAGAVGVTRSTITRMLGELRDRRLLTTVGQGEHERFCLLHWEQSQHSTTHTQRYAATSSVPALGM